MLAVKWNVTCVDFSPGAAGRILRKAFAVTLGPLSST